MKITTVQPLKSPFPGRARACGHHCVVTVQALPRHRRHRYFVCYIGNRCYFCSWLMKQYEFGRVCFIFQIAFTNPFTVTEFTIICANNIRAIIMTIMCIIIYRLEYYLNIIISVRILLNWYARCTNVNHFKSYMPIYLDITFG